MKMQQFYEKLDDFSEHKAISPKSATLNFYEVLNFG